MNYHMLLEYASIYSQMWVGITYLRLNIGEYEHIFSFNSPNMSPFFSFEPQTVGLSDSVKLQSFLLIAAEGRLN